MGVVAGHHAVVAARSRLSVGQRAAAVLGFLVALNLVIWLAAAWFFHNDPKLLGWALLAFTFGLRHALDADHICAIDNVTRKLVQQGRRPTSVGFFFSLGHSTIVVLLSVVIVLTATTVRQAFPGFERVGGLIGGSISAFFLLLLAAINLSVLRDIWRAFSQVRQGQAHDEQALETALAQQGFITRLLRPLLKLVDRGWKMYFVGFLFGLGFDTATEVGVMGIAAIAASQHLNIWTIMLFPALFTAGMCLVDTLDGILMVGAYGWAMVKPVRKLYYNLTITSISVMIAVSIAAIELLSVISDQWHPQGAFWNGVSALTDNFTTVGVAIIVAFIACWFGSMLIYRLKRFDQLEPVVEVEG